jgi:outer membrane autotransporter protein
MVERGVAGVRKRIGGRMGWAAAWFLRGATAALAAWAVFWSAGQVLAADQTVTTADDSGAGSLRQALTDVTANGSVFFDISDSPATITLGSGLSLGAGGVSLLAQPGGAVTISLSGGSNVAALTATSLGTLGGASALTIEATGTGSNVSAISSASTLNIGSIGATASLTATAVEHNVSGIRAVGDMAIGQFAGSVTASSTMWSSAIGAYGLISETGSVTIGSIAETGRIRAEIASRESYGISGATGVTIVGELAGDIEAVADKDGLIGFDAYGLSSSGGAITIGAIAETGSITARTIWSGAYGIWTSGDVTIGRMAGDISATSEMGASAYGILSANGSITIGSIAETGSISSLSHASFSGAVFASTGDVEIAGVMAGRISATATADSGGGTQAFGITAYNGAVSIGSIAATGFVSALAERDRAYALHGEDGVTIGGEMAGTLLAEATTGDEAYGVLSDGGSVSIGAIAQTGQIMALAGTNEAYGIRAWDNVTITGHMAGSIFATATGGDNAYGVLADSGDVAIGDMGGAADHWASVIALAGGDVAVGIGAELGSVTIGSIGQYSQVMATAGGMTAFGIQAGDTLTIVNDLAGMVIASAGTMAAGLTAGTVSIGSVSQTGWILAHSAGDEAYGILAACDVSIAGGMAGIISAVADGNTAVGIMAFQELNGGDPATALAVSGTVSAQADGLAVGVASGEAMNLYVTGIVAGVDTDTTDGDDGYAIRAGITDGFGGWITGSADNTVTLGTGATLVGKVDLGTGGNNTLNLLGTGALDNLFLGVDHLTAGDGSTASVWDLSLSSANASVFGDLDINALATLRINENVTIAGDTVNDGTFIYNVGTDTAYGGVISGAGMLVKDGDATLTLSGDHTYTGATIVAAGLLDVTGTLVSQDYRIAAGAGLNMASAFTLTGTALVDGTWTTPFLTIAGTGEVTGSGVINGDVDCYGLLAPGNSPGTLTIGGDLLLGSGSRLAMEITPMGHDLLHVTGTTTISGSSMHVDVASGYYANGQRFTLLTSDGGITGTPLPISLNNQSPFVRFSIVDSGIGGTNVVVGVDRRSYSIAATTRNSFGASLGLTGATLAATPAMQTILGQIDFMTLAEVEQGMRQMSPEPYSALVETSFAAMRLFSDTIRERAYAARGGGESVLAMVPGGEMSRMTELASREIGSDAPSGITATSGKAGALGLFVKPVGQYVNFDSAKNRTGFQSWQYGMVAGGDLAVNDNLLAGFQIGYVHSDLSFSDTAKSSGRSDTFLGGLYGAYSSGGFYADGLVQAGAAWNRLVRKIEFGSISTQPEGTYVSFLFGGSLTTGYDWTFGKFKAGPVATLDYGYVSVPGFSETGDAELGLTVRAFSGNSLKSGLGAKVSGTFTVGEKTAISPDVSLRWGHEFLDDSQNVKARFNGSPTSSFSAKTGEPARDSLLVDAGVSLGVSDATKLYLRYSGQLLGQGVESQAGAVGVRYEF